MAPSLLRLVLALTTAGATSCVPQDFGLPPAVPRVASDAPVYVCTEHVLGRSSTCKPVTAGRPRDVERLPVGSVPSTRSRTGKLRTRLPYAGGRLEVIGQPAAHPTHVVLLLRPVGRLAAAPCAARFFRDGDELSPDEVVRRRDHELVVTLPVAHLRDLHESTRFSARFCGLEMELDAVGRSALSDFEARFREELAAHVPAAPK